MATRIPYTASDEDIYSQLMAQFAQAQPYYSAPPAGGGGGGFMGDGLLGGYDPGLYSMPAAAAMPAMDYSYRAPTGYTGEPGPATAGGPDDGNSGWGQLTPLEQAQYYSMNPTMAAITQFGQNLFGYTTPGLLQNYLVPNFVSDQKAIANGQLMQQYMQQYDQFGNLLDMTAQGSPAQMGGQSGMSTGGIGSIGTPSGPTGADVEDAAMGAAISGGNAAISGADIGGLEGIAAPSGDGGGGGGGKIICTKLYHLGKMPKEIFEADQAFGEILVRMQPETYAGYVVWAKHVVRWMSREDFIGKTVVAITNAIATPWSIAMAEEMGVNVKSSWFGRLLLKRGLQFCAFVGGMTKKEGLQNV